MDERHRQIYKLQSCTCNKIPAKESSILFWLNHITPIFCSPAYWIVLIIFPSRSFTARWHLCSSFCFSLIVICGVVSIHTVGMLLQLLQLSSTSAIITAAATTTYEVKHELSVLKFANDSFVSMYITIFQELKVLFGMLRCFKKQ